MKDKLQTGGQRLEPGKEVKCVTSKTGRLERAILHVLGVPLAGPVGLRCIRIDWRAGGMKGACCG